MPRGVKLLSQTSLSGFDARDFSKAVSVSDCQMTYSDLVEIVNGGEFEKPTGGWLKSLSVSLSESFEFSSSRVSGFRFTVYPPGSASNITEGSTMSGGRIFMVFGVPSDVSDAFFTADEGALTNIVAAKGDLKIPKESQCERIVFSSDAPGGKKATDGITVYENSAVYIPFGFSQVMAISFDANKTFEYTAKRPGARSITAKKAPRRRLVVAAEVMLTGVAITKAISAIADIQERLGNISQTAPIEKRNSVIFSAGRKLVCKRRGEIDGEDETDEISFVEVIKSVVRLVRKNKMVVGALSAAIRRALGDGENTDAALAAITEVSEAEDIKDAIERMKNLMITNEAVAKIVMSFMGSESTPQEDAEIHLYDY